MTTTISISSFVIFVVAALLSSCSLAEEFKIDLVILIELMWFECFCMWIGVCIGRLVCFFSFTNQTNYVVLLNLWTKLNLTRVSVFLISDLSISLGAFWVKSLQHKHVTNASNSFFCPNKDITVIWHFKENNKMWNKSFDYAKIWQRWWKPIKLVLVQNTF